jgi:hypothetical protein
MDCLDHLVRPLVSTFSEQHIYFEHSGSPFWLASHRGHTSMLPNFFVALSSQTSVMSSTSGSI